jgi:hypothetical protein
MQDSIYPGFEPNITATRFWQQGLIAFLERNDVDYEFHHIPIAGKQNCNS